VAATSVGCLSWAGVGVIAGPAARVLTAADGAPEAAKRIERVLTTDPGMGIIRHADAGYEEAIEFAVKNNVIIPMKEKSSS